MLLAANRCLQLKCSVMFFPEGTRSPDGRVWKFNEGAFHLAIKAGVPVLPVVIEGSRDCLPKRSWKFGPPSRFSSASFPGGDSGLTSADVAGLRDRVRGMIVDQIAAWRNQDAASVDALAQGASGSPDRVLKTYTAELIARNHGKSNKPPPLQHRQAVV